MSGHGSGFFVWPLVLVGARQMFCLSIQSIELLVPPLLISYLQLHRRNVVRHNNDLVWLL